MDTTDYTEDWPKKGDRLFRGDLPDWQHNAVTGPLWQHDDIGPWYRYLNGYRQAADRVVESLLGKEPRGMMDVLIYPVVFLYRHNFELALKAIIRIGSRMYDEDDQIPGHHRLLVLWKKARPILEKHWPQGDPEPLDATKELLGEVDGFDSLSSSFRYPEAKDGAPSLPDPIHINIRNLGYVAGKMSEFLASCVGGLWNDLDQKETYLSDMREMYGNDGW